MGMNQKLSMKQTAELRMTPQLQQAIKLLQLSRLELEKAIRKEIEENPVLEEASDGAGDQVEKVAKTEDATAESTPDLDPRKQEEFDWESYVENQNKPSPVAQGQDFDEIMNYENMITATQTLFEYLMWQVNLFGFNDEEKAVASVLVNYIDDDGYIKTPFEQISEEEGIPVKELEEIIPFIHEFDPPGVGARNLQECLLIQAKHLEEDTNDLVDLITNHIKDLEKKNYDKIAKSIGREIGDVVEMCKIIYEMEPKPGRAYMPPETIYVTPDVYVAQVGDEFIISLNEDGLPRLRVSNLYKNILSGKGENNVTQDYIKEKLKSAVWLIKSIHQRQRTIYRVTESIVKHQREFFEKGPAFIRPMILRDIASDVGIHESTVSRVTTSKYVHTPQGIFELKYFFNSGVSKTDGDSLASESVKLKIKDLVAKENPKKPLSDQEIVNKLKAEGIQIARRTVAKYRDALNVLPSSKRKKMF
jgi:RNA polymerase sigma-54 factor